MGQAKKVIVVICLGLTTSCGKMFDLTPWDDDEESPEESTISDEPSIEATAAYAIALGGVAEGRDELVIYNADGEIREFSGHTLEFELDNDNIELTPRPGFNDFAGGSGALITPKRTGTTIISYKIDGVEQEDKYKVIVPPQSLIQILMGEARGQIADEALVENGAVALTSESPTANAIGAVVRNRVLLIEAGQPLSLFVVDEDAWEADPPASHWDAVITAEKGGVYQFSPLDPDTASYEIYFASEYRDNLEGEEELSPAYDQAVLTAAGIFTNETVDPTGGAFAFRTPPTDDAECLAEALESNVTELPEDCGPGDENYPAFAPVQVLIHPSVALLSDGRPSFIFYRNRSQDEPAVTNAP